MAGSTTFTWQHALLLHSTKSPFDSPVPQTHRAFAGVQPVSWQRKNIAGLLVTIYGLQEIPADASEIACLWLLHGRGDTQDSMGYCAAALIHSWNQHCREQQQQQKQKGLIVVCFDQRNHGSRMVEHAHNESWKQGNATHGPDMFASYVGSAQDLSLLISLLPAYLSAPAVPPLTRHLCGGVSLGGHATWVALMRDPRVTAGLVVVGCPDYARLMTDRALRAKLPSTRGGAAGFVGSADFPPSLVQAVKEFDPAGILTGLATEEQLRSRPSEAEQGKLRGVLERTLKGKKILCLSGKKDRLVPYEQGEPFLTWLKAAVSTEDGWARDMGVDLRDLVDPDGRHEFSALMRREAEQWLCDVLSEDETKSSPTRESKM